MMRLARLGFVVIVMAWTAAACGKGSSDDAAKVPPKPANGSPIAVEFLELTGEGADRGVRARLYNFGDKKAAGYVVLARYYDEGGALLKAKAGTPFEKDHDFTSLSGRPYVCEPKKHKEIEIDMLDVPAEAARAELLVSKVDAVAEDGMTIEDWWSQESWNEWPEAASGDGS